MSVEEWRPIPDWPGYQASSLGRIRSHVLHPEGRVMKLRLNPSNLYWTAGPSRDGKQKWIPVHVLVASAFHGLRPDSAVVRHLDGSRDNNRPENLAWGTPAENMEDMVRHHGAHPSTIRAATVTHCKVGHPFIEANTMVLGKRSGPKGRRCAACFYTATLSATERKLTSVLEAIRAAESQDGEVAA